MWDRVSISPHIFWPCTLARGSAPESPFHGFSLETSHDISRVFPLVAIESLGPIRSRTWVAPIPPVLPYINHWPNNLSDKPLITAYIFLPCPRSPMYPFDVGQGVTVHQPNKMENAQIHSFIALKARKGPII